MEGGSRNSPEDTNVIFQPTLVHGSMCLYFKFELCTQRWHVPSQNHEPSWEKLRFARNLYQNLFLFCNFFYHSMVVPWHDIHAKFHDFQMCFGFTRILKPRFSMFSAEPRCPDVLILFSFLAWDLEIHSRTQIWFFNQLWCTRACACSSTNSINV